MGKSDTRLGILAAPGIQGSGDCELSTWVEFDPTFPGIEWMSAITVGETQRSLGKPAL